MKSLAVLFFFVGILCLFSSGSAFEASRKQQQAQSVALNYALWRAEVLRYVFDGHKEAGDIPFVQLQLPVGWLPLRPWKARVEDGHCYAYGPASVEEIELVRDLFKQTFALGRAENGKLVPGHGQIVPVPGIPEGSLVSVVNLD
ncbi:MAG: type IV pilus biogenesis protein PilM [Bilophila sp.]